jgi:hypothetical protein
MAKLGDPYWSGGLALHWMAQAGIEEQPALKQLERAIGEGELRAIGRRCQWRNVGIPFGDIEIIPPQEASDLSLMLGTRDTLHLYPLYGDNKITYFCENSKQICNAEADTYLSWSAVLLNASDMKRLWPGNGKPAARASTNNQKGRQIAPEKAATLRNKIEMVLAVARRRFGEQEPTPPDTAMAAELTKPEHKLEYDQGTIRQILNGTYSPAKRLGIGPFKSNKSSRPDRG